MLQLLVLLVLVAVFSRGALRRLVGKCLRDGDPLRLWIAGMVLGLGAAFLS
jgi:hypothetical protein